MELQKTINYFQFKRIESNRPVDQRHVNELITKIKEKNLLHLFPILVNGKMEVVDGQHRLAAAEQQQLYVYYVIDDNISKSDIANVNAVSKNWSINDYINYWTVENRTGFDKLSGFMLENPLIPPSTVLMMLSVNKKCDIKGIRSGQIDVSNIEQANDIATKLNWFKSIAPIAYDRNFIMAFLNLMSIPGYDHEIMQRKVELQPRSLVKCVTVKQYMEMFDEIYNYGSSKNRLNIR